MLVSMNLEDLHFLLFKPKDVYRVLGKTPGINFFLEKIGDEARTLALTTDYLKIGISQEAMVPNLKLRALIELLLKLAPDSECEEDKNKKSEEEEK